MDLGIRYGRVRKLISVYLISMSTHLNFKTIYKIVIKKSFLPLLKILRCDFLQTQQYINNIVHESINTLNPEVIKVHHTILHGSYTVII